MLEGIVSNEVIKAAIEGKICPYVICGVDVYITPEVAAEDGVKTDESRRLPFAIPLATGMVDKPEAFFSGRHYRVIHLLDLEHYDPQSTVADLRKRMIELKATMAGHLNDAVLEQEDGDTAYY